jgi:hypothetical protein
MIASNPTRENASLSLFECFPYGCPEPVLAKMIILSTKWRKKTRFLTCLIALVREFPNAGRASVGAVKVQRRLGNLRKERADGAPTVQAARETRSVFGSICHGQSLSWQIIDSQEEIAGQVCCAFYRIAPAALEVVRVPDHKEDLEKTLRLSGRDDLHRAEGVLQLHQQRCMRHVGVQRLVVQVVFVVRVDPPGRVIHLLAVVLTSAWVRGGHLRVLPSRSDITAVRFLDSDHQ